ncbi:helicase [Cellulomonas humilata]|uniref:Helicase n=1 Tax=Cellulomonas humilata TaxID=144055 RepID=A0A7Y6A3J6_9CELL|nr:helicase-related protein [Cellulomonas humilata]NUU18453.1 helicase [Cellulomonas humilata]
MRPDPAPALASLKDFQHDTVEYAFRRLWTDEDQVKRFLVADEVGLGKTMVAKGVISKTVEHLWDTDKRIDIVYICSNSQIARQNLSRLNVVGGSEVKHADRLTLLPKVIRNLREQRVNFVSFTPGTSFKVGNSGGAYAERVLLYWMLADCWGTEVSGRVRWKKFFEGGMNRGNFQDQLAWFDRSSLDEDLCVSFGQAIEGATGPNGGPLRAELDACATEFNYMRGRPSGDLGSRRDRLVGTLRQLVARAAVEHLEPDLVILDEFQRFKDLLDADDEGARLANAIFDHPDAKVLLLSATPYKMYTLPDEPEGDDHYQDFTRTVRFLAGDERAHVVERELRAMRETLVLGGDPQRARDARHRVEIELRRVMSRTERLSSTPDRDGMLSESTMPGVELAVQDLRSWRTFDDVARQIDRHDVFEYWRSTPYPLNLMERGSYQVRTKFQAAAECNDPKVATILASSQGLLSWNDIRTYQQVDPGNAKMRGLSADVLDRGAWRLAWLPPALPYYEPAGAYAEPDLRAFTKRLIFSAWAVVPKAIAVMISYEAERRGVEAAGLSARAYDDRPITPPLQFRMDGERVAGMPALALLYPSLSLALAGDPLEIARSRARELPMARESLLEVARERVRVLLQELPDGHPGAVPDQRWYWAAPFLFDRVLWGSENEPFLKTMRTWNSEDDDVESRVGAHIRAADAVDELVLGPRPDDLGDVLATMAIAGPGVCALRALSRVTGGSPALADPVIRASAYEIAQGLRSLFNKPEIVALLRSGEEDEAYWRAVLDHALDGCLQSVLDEYAHVLIESEGLQDASAHTRASTLTDTMTEALSIRTAANAVEDVQVVDGEIRLEDRRINSHFAARYGRTQSSDQAMVRETTVRTAYNSPFRPFVLASTSVGQEGLDFHTYSHAIVHWNLPGNPVDLEQREGRVHRYKGHAVRKNVAAEHGGAALEPRHDDPWVAMFDAARSNRAPEDSDIKPFWIFTRPGGAVIERYVPALPLSLEAQQYHRLLRTVGAYRLILGQPRQDDLVRYVGADATWLRIDLTPPSRPRAAVKSTATAGSGAIANS